MEKYAYIGNNCIGGLIYKHFKEQYNDPFIWSLIPNDFEYVRLCRDFDDYIQCEPITTTINPDSRWRKSIQRETFDDKIYPVLDVSGIEVHWIHNENQENKVVDSYKRRIVRYKDIRPKVFFLFNFFTLFQDHSHEELLELATIFNQHKHSAICLLPDDLEASIYDSFYANIGNNVVIIPGMKWKESDRNPWGYNKQDTPDKKLLFIRILSEIKSYL
jgi:hypothetical protein